MRRIKIVATEGGNKPVLRRQWHGTPLWAPTGRTIWARGEECPTPFFPRRRGALTVDPWGPMVLAALGMVGRGRGP